MRARESSPSEPAAPAGHLRLYVYLDLALCVQCYADNTAPPTVMISISSVPQQKAWCDFSMPLPARSPSAER